MVQLVLASSSPRRKELLTQIGIGFEVMPSNIDENLEEIEGTPQEKAERLALLKARDVAGHLEKGLVLGADTIVILDDTIFGKPKDDDDAYDMIRRLSGREHIVTTGVALVDAESGRYASSYETTRVKFRNLTHDDITGYLGRGTHSDKAGAYGIQGIGALLVEKIDGCYFNVVGLPLVRLGNMLEPFGAKLL